MVSWVHVFEVFKMKWGNRFLWMKMMRTLLRNCEKMHLTNILKPQNYFIGA